MLGVGGRGGEEGGRGGAGEEFTHDRKRGCLPCICLKRGGSQEGVIDDDVTRRARDQLHPADYLRWNRGDDADGAHLLPREMAS